jgi:methionyl-tRNA formyltransferase
MAVAEPSTYVVAGVHPWNRAAFDAATPDLPGRWVYLGAREELTVEALEALDPRYVFFLHWSWLVPEEIFDRWECVCFHMADVPYGRGGSPLQNLVLRGHEDTKLTALRMTGELDAGPVYAKLPLSLDGTAESILTRASELSFAMAAELVADEPTPVPQEGEVVAFERRTPSQSVLPGVTSLDEVQD